MNQEDLKAFISMAGLVLQVDEVVAVSLKAIFAELDTIESLMSLRAQLNQMGESEEANHLRIRLDALEQGMADRVAATRKLLNDSIARIESNHEELQSFLAQLKSMLG